MGHLTFRNRLRTAAVAAAMASMLAGCGTVAQDALARPLASAPATASDPAGPTNPLAPKPAEVSKHLPRPKPSVKPTTPALVPDFKLPPIENGLAPVITRIPTTQKVVFLTIDDGAVKSPKWVELLHKNGIKASLFLAQAFIHMDPGYFKAFTAQGSLVEDHTINHPLDLIYRSYEEQKAEICQMADYEQQHYGRRPVFFRPPGGPYSTATRQAVAACGLKAIIDWEAKANAGGMDYQVGSGLRPGDIVLMHFRPEFEADLNAFLKARKAAGLQVVLLEDYLKTG